MVRLTHCETGVVVVVDEVTADGLGPGWVLPEEAPADPKETEEAPADPKETEEAPASVPPEKGRGKGAHAKSDG